MDILSVINQRHSEANTELRHTRCLFVGHTAAACGFLIAAVTSLVARARSGSGPTFPRVATNVFWTVVFAVLSAACYVLAVRGLRLLNTNRFLPPPVYTNPRAFSSLLAPPPLGQLSRAQRIVFSYGFNGASFLALLAGMAAMPFTVYLLLQILAVALFVMYAAKLLRLMTPGANVS